MGKPLYLMFGGFIGVLLSIVLFPTVEPFHFSVWLGELIFNPFNLLGAAASFIGGFLSFSTLFKDLFEKWYNRKQTTFHGLDWIVMVCLLILYIILFLINVWVTLASLIIAMYYSIMDLIESYQNK